MEPAPTSKTTILEPTFEEAGHTYRLDGKLLTPVSTVLDWGQLKGSFQPGRGGLNLAARIGTAAHKAIALEIRGRLRESSVDRRVRPYLEAFRRFRDDQALMPLNIELMVWSDPMAIAGTLDMKAIIGKERDQWLIDWKTGAKAPWHAVQTAAYAWLLKERPRRAAVYLRDDATYSLDEHDDPMDYSGWEGAINVAAWRKHRNLVL